MSVIRVTNPATEAVITELETDTPSSLASKFECAKAQQRRWRDSAMQERVSCALRFKALLLENVELLAQDLTSETGKPITQSRSEIKAVTARIDFFVEHAPQVLATQTVSTPHAKVEERVEYEALGVVANISAWNYPYFVGLNVLVPALLAGNAVLYKPSEFSSISGLHIIRLLTEAGFPKHLVASAIGGGDVGESLLALPIAGVFFTGSYQTGKRILNVAGSKMIRLQLELGGKDGIYVCEDSALDYAVPSIADGAFYNTGQGCCSVERIFVHDSIYESFKEALVREVSSFKVGDPRFEDTYIGALTRPQHLGFLEQQVEDAKKNGANVLLGGHRFEQKGSFFAPTVVECSADCSLLNDESFGPIVAIQSVTSDEHAIRKLNDSNYGLTAGVYSKSRDRAIKILHQVDVGSAYWNCCDRVSPYLPWSGRKASGIGATLGLDGIRSFAQSKAWHLKSTM